MANKYAYVILEEVEEWKIMPFDNQGNHIAAHKCSDNEGSYAWPFKDESGPTNTFYKHQCMNCGKKVPEYLSVQLDLLNG